MSSCFHIVHFFANSFLPSLMLPTQEHIMAAQFIWGTAFKKVPRGRKVCLSQFAFYLCILIFPTLNLLTISSQVMMMSKENELQNDISSLNLCNNSSWKALSRLCSIHFVCYAVFYWLTQEARSSIDKRQTLWMWTHSLSHISHILCFDFSSNHSIPARIKKITLTNFHLLKVNSVQMWDKSDAHS